jgi:predicted DNA-binding transcriptional regulator AlpA
MGIERNAEACGEITWEEIGRDPARAEHLSDHALRPLERLHAIVGGYLRAQRITLDGVPAPQPEPDRLLKVKEAADRIGVTVDTLYRNADDYPFTRRTEHPRALRFSDRGITEWMKAGGGKYRVTPAKRIDGSRLDS